PTTAILARVEVLCRRHQLDAAREVLAAEIENASAADRAALRSRLAQLIMQEGNLAESRQAIADLVEHDSRNLQLLQTQAELAIEAHDQDQAMRCEAQLRDLEGEDGT